MNTSERSAAEVRIHEIRLRVLDIKTSLREMKRKFFVDGEQTNYNERITLEAELASLNAEAAKLSSLAFEAKVQRKQQEKLEFTEQLVRLLKERGQGELIAEAKRRTDANMKA